MAVVGLESKSQKGMVLKDGQDFNREDRSDQDNCKQKQGVRKFKIQLREVTRDLVWEGIEIGN